jgi:hypothetical protein
MHTIKKSVMVLDSGIVWNNTERASIKKEKQMMQSSSAEKVGRFERQMFGCTSFDSAVWIYGLLIVTLRDELLKEKE